MLRDHGKCFRRDLGPARNPIHRDHDHATIRNRPKTIRRPGRGQDLAGMDRSLNRHHAQDRGLGEMVPNFRRLAFAMVRLGEVTKVEETKVGMEGWIDHLLYRRRHHALGRGRGLALLPARWRGRVGSLLIGSEGFSWLSIRSNAQRPYQLSSL